MTENIKKEDIQEKPLPSDGAEKEEKVVPPEQDPLKVELENIQKPSRTKKEKLLFSKERIEQQLAELGEDGGSELDEDDKPVTVGMLKKIQTETAIKSALQLADEIPNETERELAKYHIENTIRPTGDPKKDLALAMVHVTAIKNKQILEEVARKAEPKRHTSDGGSNPRDGKVEEELTVDEIPFTKPPFNMSKADILKARK